jgi:hypothetical protein
MFNVFKEDYVNWRKYKKKIDFIDDFYFQQRTRRESMKNLGFY